MRDEVGAERAEETKPEQARSASPERQTHTPGPWAAAVELRHHNHRGGFSVQTEDGTVICGRFGWPQRVEESTANAYLIAAAPELLEACRLFAAAHTTADYHRGVKKAQLAIAKAEGR